MRACLATSIVPPGLRERLESGEVHVWVSRPERCDAALRSRHLALLSTDEAQACGRLRFERDREVQVLGRALLRTVLSRYGEPSPRAWRFASGPFGKPHVAPAEGLEDRLSFNVSHTRGLAAVAVAVDRRVGVDVECTRSPAPMDEVAAFFSRDEIRAWQALGADEREHGFWSTWTLKESFIKAVGEGLSMPLDSFSVDVGVDGRIGLTTDAGCEGSWRFMQCRPSDDHVLALCAEGHGMDPLAACVMETVPLQAGSDRCLSC